MTYKPGDSYFTLFVIDGPASGGAAVDADALPVATACHNGVDDGGFVLTVTRLDSGRYKAAGTVPGGYAAGDTVNVWVAATISGAACKSVVDKFGVDTRRLADITSGTGPAAGVVLAPNGLDAVSVTPPAGAAGTFREMVVMVYRRFFKATDLNATRLRCFGDDGTTVITSQALSDDGTTQTQGAAT